MNYSPFEMLFVITSRNKLGLVDDVFLKYGICGNTTLMGKGTAASVLGDIFGFGIIDRDVVTAVVNSSDRLNVINDVSDSLNLTEPHNGVAFSININAITSDILDILNLSYGGKNMKPLKPIKKPKMEKTELENTNENDLIVCIINRGYADYVVDASRDAGATGATILYGRSSVKGEEIELNGINIQAEKEVVLIVVDKKIRKKVMQEISDRTHPTEKGNGIVFSLPVNDIRGGAGFYAEHKE